MSVKVVKLKEGTKDNDARLKSYAFQIIAQLPESEADALDVLWYAEQLLNWRHKPRKRTIED